MNVYIPGDGFATQGPCPDGFHVPNKSEWEGLISAMSSLGIAENKAYYQNYLHIPQAWFRDNSGYKNTSNMMYWTCTPSGTYEAYIWHQPSYSIGSTLTRSRTYGYPIRSFKDEFVVPDSNWTTSYGTLGGAGIFYNQTEGIISITTNGTTGYTISDKNLGATTVYNNGDGLSLDNMGGVFQRGNNYCFISDWSTYPKTSSTAVDTTGYGPGNYYSGDTYITSGNDWSSVQNDNLRGGLDGNVKFVNVLKNAYIGEYKGYTPGIYHNSTDGLISFSSDGTNWYTIADKNLGASTVYNNGDTLSASNCGYYYQWGNNYGFPWTGSISSSSTQVNASNYGPTNPYSSSTFIYYSSGRNWDSSNNMNLWGDITDTLEARKGPCNIGFHVPTDSDLTILCDTLTSISGEQIGDALKKYALMPLNGYRNGNTSSGEITLRDTFGHYWSSSTESFSYGTYPYQMYFYSTGKSITDTPTSIGANVRPFKNEPVIPNSSWTKLN